MLASLMRMNLMNSLFDYESIRDKAQRANTLIKSKQLNKTSFLRKFQIKTVMWDDFVSGRRKSFKETTGPKLDAVFTWFGL